MGYSEDVKAFVIENFLYGEDDGLKDDTSFLDTGIIDSTGMLELVDFLETTYDVELEDEELVPENLDGVEKVAAFLERKLAAK
jgi:acyl carrier protein